MHPYKNAVYLPIALPKQVGVAAGAVIVQSHDTSWPGTGLLDYIMIDIMRRESLAIVSAAIELYVQRAATTRALGAITM